MMRSLHALITRQGNVVRSEIARPATVARYLATAHPLAEYYVVYWYQGKPSRVTAEGFLALYEAGSLRLHGTREAPGGPRTEVRRS